MMKSKYSSCQFNVTLYFQKIDDDDPTFCKTLLFFRATSGAHPMPVSQFILPPGQVAPRGATCPGISYPPPWLPSPPGGNISRLVYLAPRG